MPKLIPIRALRFQSDDGDVSTRIAPPYDVLDEGPKQKLLQRDPHNIVAVDLPVTPPKTVGPDEAYEQAGELFRQWVADGALVPESEPAMYAYEQVYKVGDQQYARRGLFTAVEVQPFNQPKGVFRHEMTFRSGTDDRLKLMEATAAQLSPVFSVFDDPDEHFRHLLAPVFEKEPTCQGTTGHDNVLHRLWTITDPTLLESIEVAMANADVFIADGHHRYTTALNYREAHPDQPNAAGCLMVLVPIQDPGLIVLPTHRVLRGLVDFEMTRLIDIIQSDGRFNIEKTNHGGDGTPQMEEDLPNFGPHALGLYDPSTGRTWAVSAKSDDPLADELPDKPAVWRQLDVAVFHELLVDRIIRPNFGGDAIAYSYPHELTELIKQSHEEPGRLGVIMQPTPLRSVCDVARAGEVMPQKSTFFFPKLATGLVINPLD